MRLLVDNLIDNDDTVITASSEAPGYPVRNLRNRHRSKVWRATAAASETVNIDLGGAKTVKAFAMTGYNLTLDGTVEVLYSSDNISFSSVGKVTIATSFTGFGEGGFGVGGFGGFSPEDPLPGHTVTLFFSDPGARYWQVKIEDPGNSDGYVQVGRIFLGDFWQPSGQIARGWRVEPVDETEIDKTIGGQKANNERPIFLRVTFRLPHLSESDAIDKFIDIVKENGVKKDIFLVLFPDEGQNMRFVTSIYGNFTGTPSITNVGIGTYDTGDVTFEESL